MHSIADRSQSHRRPRLQGAGRLTSTRRGTSAVEAAVVLPVIGLLLLACSDIGRAVHAQIVVTNAVRVGAEYGATHRFTDETRTAWEVRLRDVMREELLSLQDSSPELMDATVTTSQPNSEEVRIEVMATYPFPMIVAWPGLPNSLDLTHTVTMRQYQ
ncbi:MAG: TadE family protein [Pirellulales bacterium]